MLCVTTRKKKFVEFHLLCPASGVVGQTEVKQVSIATLLQLFCLFPGLLNLSPASIYVVSGIRAYELYLRI